MHGLKYAAVGIAALLGTALIPSDANAFVCAKGPYRAGCVSAYGAVGVSRNGVVAVGPYGNTYAYRRGAPCYWRNGYRVCPSPYYW